MTLQVEEQVKDHPVTNGRHQGESTAHWNQRVPPLDSGDRLTRVEFERRYHLHPEIKKAELIEGVVYVASPVRVKQHGEPHSHIVTWLGVYLASTPGLRMADNSTYRLDEENEPQPDVSLWIEQKGNAQIDEDDYLVGAPELLIEVAASTASIDLGAKKDAYLRQGVQEYLILQVYEQKTTWFTLRDGNYQEIQADPQGILQSSVFPGLWLDPQKYWAGDVAGVLAILQQGMATPEHTTFVETLASNV
jgi:Uma2 family endonuclease